MTVGETADHVRRWADHGWGKTLRILWTATAVIATVALALAITGLIDQTANRRDSAHDSCELLRGLVLTAAPAARQAAVKAYIARTPLRNCNQYADRIVK